MIGWELAVCVVNSTVCVFKYKMFKIATVWINPEFVEKFELSLLIQICSYFEIQCCFHLCETPCKSFYKPNPLVSFCSGREDKRTPFVFSFVTTMYAKTIIARVAQLKRTYQRNEIAPKKGEGFVFISSSSFTWIGFAKVFKLVNFSCSWTNELKCCYTIAQCA